MLCTVMLCTHFIVTYAKSLIREVYTPQIEQVNVHQKARGAPSLLLLVVTHRDCHLLFLLVFTFNAQFSAFAVAYRKS